MLTFQNSYAQLDVRLFHKQSPVSLKNPQAGHFNPLVAKQIGWADDEDLMKNWVNILAGEYLPINFEPLAMAYAGYQFGQWAGQLGDGRGLLLTQIIDKSGNLTDLHLKGAGLTPYSRRGDGRAVIRSTVREYLAGHLLNQLGIRSSNALGFIVSDTPVFRETAERGATLLRTADCHIRFGHFEWIASFCPDLMLEFTQYTIHTYFKECLESATPIEYFLRQVVKQTAETIANWQLFGFAHGVMNTDNMSITGATLDFGPYGFMERFNPSWINNHSDYQGRYVYQNQPSIALWNLTRLITHFLRLNGQKLTINHEKAYLTHETLSEILDCFADDFHQFYQQNLCKKFGLPNSEENCNFALQYLTFMENNQLDFTNSLRALVAIVANKLNRISDFPHEQQLYHTLLSEISSDELIKFQQWQHEYLAKITQVDFNQIQQSNPIYILRNGMAQQAIAKAEQNDFNEVARLFELLKNPYTLSKLAKPSDSQPPNANEPEICASCSS